MLKCRQDQLGFPWLSMIQLKLLQKLFCSLCKREELPAQMAVRSTDISWLRIRWTGEGKDKEQLLRIMALRSVPPSSSLSPVSLVLNPAFCTDKSLNDCLCWFGMFSDDYVSYSYSNNSGIKSVVAFFVYFTQGDKWKGDEAYQIYCVWIRGPHRQLKHVHS